jgi:hypothetical protein
MSDPLDDEFEQIRETASVLKPAVPVEISAQSSPSGVYSGKRGFVDTSAPSDVPTPTFTVLGADVVKIASGPTLKFTVGVNEPQGREVFTIALVVQIQLDPAKRKYDNETKAKLIELFGEPSRWPATTRAMPWAEIHVLVPTFTGAGTFEVPMLSNFDMELAATKYLYSLPDGEVPLSFHFSGSIYYRGHDGGIQIVQVPWSASADFRLPIERWRSMVDFYYPNTAWVAMRRQTLDELLKYKASEGLATFDACLRQLLGVEDFHQPNPFAFKPRSKEEPE